MRVYYLSSADVFDTDMNVLPDLSKMHQITFGLLIPKLSRGFRKKELENLMTENRRIRLETAPLRYRRRNPLNIPVYIRLILSIRRGQYDIIYLNDFEDIYFRVLFAAFIRKSRTIYGIHDVTHHSGWQHKLLLRETKELFLRKFNTVLTFSESQAKQIGPKCQRVFAVPMALKHFGAKPLVQKDYRTIQFLFFGTIAAYKGLDILIDAVKRLSMKYGNFRLTIAGRCSDWEDIYEPLIAGNRCIVPDIRFIENAEIPKYFAAAHYLILPYKDVTQSGPLMIAYDYHVPVISSDLEGFREFVKDGITGYTFGAGSAAQLEKVMEKCLLRSEEAYERLVNNLKRFVSGRFSAENIASRYSGIFEEVYRN